MKTASPLGWAALGLAAISVKVVGGVVAAHEEARLSGEVGVDLRGAVLDAWLHAHSVGDAGHGDHGAQNSTAPDEALGVAALTERVREMETGLAKGLLGGARAIVQLVPLVFVWIMLAPKLAFSAIAILAVFSVFLSAGRAAFKREQRRLAAEHEALLGSADEAVRHADLWKTYGAEEKIRTHVANVGSRIAAYGARLEARAAAWSGANEILGAVALVVVLGLARAGIVGESSAASLLPFAVAFFLAYRPLKELADARLAWSRATVAGEDVARSIVPAPHAVRSAGSPRAWPLDILEMKHLDLVRGNAAPLSLFVEPGSIVAIVGANGAGKTTLLRTLLGLEKPRAGSISYGSARIENAGTGPSARPFAWVPQEAPLLADTLHANVALAAASDPQVQRALAEMGLGALAAELGDQRIGTGRRRVSGGERRAIAVARALATELPVLLLDEPTAGLDAAARARLLAAIAKLEKKRTVILVTHDREPLAIADEVIELGGTNESARISAA